MKELQIFDELEKVAPGFEGIGVLAGLLDMPDKEFHAFAPIVLEEIQKELTNSNSKFSLVSALESSGTSIDGLKEAVDDILTNFDEEFSKYSEEKQSFLKSLITTIQNTIEMTKAKKNKRIQIPIEKCNDDAVIPSYACLNDAGMDIYSVEDCVINPGESKLVHTGLKCAIPEGYELQVRPRSGMSLKTKVRIANAPGTIDTGYRGEIGVIVDNIEPPIKDITYHFEDKKPVIDSILHGAPYTINKGDRIAQFILQEIPGAQFVEVPSVIEIGEDRGGGFGHSGK